MPDAKREKYPQRWRMFWFGGVLVVMLATASALTLRITDPEKLMPLALSTVFYGAIVGFIFQATATARWRRRKAADGPSNLSMKRFSIGIKITIGLLVLYTFFVLSSSILEFVRVMSVGSGTGPMTFFGGKLLLALLATSMVAYAVYRLISIHNRASVLWALGAAWALGLGWSLGKDLLFLHVTGEMSSRFPAVLILPSIFSAGITAYLVFSKRVRETYS